MKKGCIKRKVIKCLIVGAAGVGKTSIKHLLLNKELPEKRVSTGVTENPTRAVSIARANMKEDGSWYVMDNDEELTKMIAILIKARSHESASTTPKLVTDQDSEVQDEEVTTGSHKDSISSKVISEIMEAKGV